MPPLFGDAAVFENDDFVGVAGGSFYFFVGRIRFAEADAALMNRVTLYFFLFRIFLFRIFFLIQK